MKKATGISMTGFLAVAVIVMIMGANAYAQNGTISLSTDNSTLTVVGPPTVEDRAGYVGSSATFNVVPTGAGPYTYQWKLGNGTPITGANSQNYSVPITLLAQNSDTYYCTVGNAGGDQDSNLGTLFVYANPNLVLTVTGEGLNGVYPDFAINSGSHVPPLTYTCTVTPQAGDPAPIVAYQWKKDGIVLAGETNQDLVIDPVTGADAANTPGYSCEVTCTATTP